MTVQPAGGSLDRPNASNLADVVDTILDKGLVIDAYVRVSLVGIELLTIDARVVIASVDTYLRFAEAVNRLDLSEGQQHGLPDLLEDVNKGGAKSRTSGALEAAGEKLSGLLNSDSDDESDEDDEYEREPAHRDRRR
jgi:hypothetical protein